MTDNAALIALTVPQLDVDEGFRAKAYLDTRGIPTIGWGRADGTVRLGQVTTEAAEAAWRDAKLNSLCDGLDAAIPWWRNMNMVRQSAALNLAYNRGVHGLLEFTHFVAFLKAGSYTAAAVELRHTQPWASQVGDRAQRLADAFRTGVAPA